MSGPFGDSLITGRHRAKIGAHQRASEETLAAARLNLHMLGPGEPALSEWAAAGLSTPDLDAIRSYRLERVRRQLVGMDYAGVLLYDPVNIRYATDSTNMQLWVAHNPTRYALVLADGPVIVWDYMTSEHLSAHLDLVDEMRTAVQWMYQFAGAETERNLARWAAEIADIVDTYGGGNRRLAIDRANPVAILALDRLGIDVRNGEEVMELARAVKSADEIVAMRCAIHACETAMDKMYEALAPGMTENEVWAVLHAENIIRFGEWIETRLLSSGPRTNPWFQESSSRVIEAGDIVAFDTDLIGAYGYCVDISRTWIAGRMAPTPHQRDAWERAAEQIRHNTDLLGPGVTLKELTFGAMEQDTDQFRRYSVQYHGVGLADEWPSVYFRDSWDEVGVDGVLQPGQVICVEAYVGRRDRPEGAKLEEQVLITETGRQVLSTYPLELG
ncbi:MAG TPA: Xaa-Pro peptidase family protein [Acidimicrobiia bacterium]|nr:Xaa-Pro peptidase family protein [Acidimicrobiia bacterium]